MPSPRPSSSLAARASVGTWSRVGAVLSADGLYRFLLTRDVAPEGAVTPTRTVCWVMLNPSTADAEQDDATVRRCMTFTRTWGYTSLAVVNLFALRSTDPSVLRSHAQAIGCGNDAYIIGAAMAADLVVCAWGTKGDHLGRDAHVLTLLADTEPHALDLTKDGHPKHPLYVKGDTLPFRIAAEERP